MSALQDLFSFLTSRGLADGAEVRQRWLDYIALLEQFNARANLIGPMDQDEIIRNLLIDSVAVVQVSIPAGRVLDVGSGAGLPGIPLKLAVPDFELTMVEPRRKRSDFLRIARHRLQLDGVDVVDDRIEGLQLEPFDWVISKAFRPPVEWLQTAMPLTKPGGTIVCMHACGMTVTALDECAERLGLRLESRIVGVFAHLAIAGPADRAITSYIKPTGCDCCS
jgi:16S rRNA (guanine527-N7)-methyltransferase